MVGTAERSSGMSSALRPGKPRFERIELAAHVGQGAVLASGPAHSGPNL